MFNEMTLYCAGGAVELRAELALRLLHRGVRLQCSRRGDDLELRVEGASAAVERVLDELPYWYAAWRRGRGLRPGRCIAAVAWVTTLGCVEGGTSKPDLEGLLVINEVEPHVSAGGDWFEIYNGSFDPVDTAELVVAVSGDVFGLAGIGIGLLDPGEFGIVPCGAGASVSEGLDYGGDDVALYVRGALGALTELDTIGWESIAPGTVYARFPDGDGLWTMVGESTPGAPNAG